MSAKRKVGQGSRRAPTKGKVTARQEPRPTALHEDAPPYRVAGVPSIARQEPPQAEQCSALRFIDLFCGIGGFRLAFERARARCVFSSDWDKFSRQTYAANFGEEPHGDIHSVAVADIPKFDILCGGFPCQPFSLAGVSKKNSLGRQHGFQDEKQGNLFFSIAEILDYHQPPAFVLENVKHLVRHDQGRSFQIIHDTLTNALGYQVSWKIINAQSVVPQHRQRIFLVGFKPGRAFEFPEFPAEGPKLASILDPDAPAKYTLTDHLWNYLQAYLENYSQSNELWNAKFSQVIEGRIVERWRTSWIARVARRNKNNHALSGASEQNTIRVPQIIAVVRILDVVPA